MGFRRADVRHPLDGFGVLVPQLERRLVHEELADLLGVMAPPVFTHVHRVPAAIPQYELGHERFLDANVTVQGVRAGIVHRRKLLRRHFARKLHRLRAAPRPRRRASSSERGLAAAPAALA
jgi:hypothetical protein